MQGSNGGRGSLSAYETFRNVLRLDHVVRYFHTSLHLLQVVPGCLGRGYKKPAEMGSHRRRGSRRNSLFSTNGIRGVAGLSGGTSLTYSYDAFGNTRARTGTSAQPFQYLENAYDSSSKLHDFHARMYEQSTGRFLTKDPISGVGSVPQTLNPYPCSVNNPLAHPDPYGMFPANMSSYYITARANQKTLPDTGGPGGQQPCDASPGGDGWMPGTATATIRLTTGRRGPSSRTTPGTRTRGTGRAACSRRCTQVAPAWIQLSPLLLLAQAPALSKLRGYYIARRRGRVEPLGLRPSTLARMP